VRGTLLETAIVLGWGGGVEILVSCGTVVGSEKL
jgi:hypothetical protein